MTLKWIRRIGLAVAGLVLLTVVAGVLVLRSDWFKQNIRTRIVDVAEEATGGKVELGAFDFDWLALKVTLRDFVLHGTEPKNADPLFRAKRIELGLKFFSGSGQSVDLASLEVDTPRANLIVKADGSTNVPEPKVKTKSPKSPLETVIDLKVGRFALENGAVVVNGEEADFSAKGAKLRTQLAYDRQTPGYQGRFAVNPLEVKPPGMPVLNLKIELPVVIGKDRIQLNEGQIGMGASLVMVNGAVEHLGNPRGSAHVTARVGKADVERLAGIPMDLEADVSVEAERDVVRIPTARANLGASTLEASGELRDPSGKGAVQFNASLALGELGRLLKLDARPQGVLRASGKARLPKAGGYSVDGHVEGQALAATVSGQVYRGLSINTAFTADPKRISVSGLRLGAFGGELRGKGAIEQLAKFQFDGSLEGFHIRTLAQELGARDVPYDGVIAGPVQASGDLKVPGTEALRAAVQLGITPGQVSGRLVADYDGSADLVSLADSYVALPHSRIDLSGALNNELQVKFVSRGLQDFQPLLKDPVPLELGPSGQVRFTGSVRGKLTAPQMTGRAEATEFTVEGRAIDRFSADATASQSGVKVTNGVLDRASAKVQFNAQVGFVDWVAKPEQPLSVQASFANAELADLLALAGQKDLRLTGQVNGTARIGGSVGSPGGTAKFTVSNGTAYDAHFDRLVAGVDFEDRQVRVSGGQLDSGAGRADFSGVFEHPKDVWSSGTVQARLSSNDMPLKDYSKRLDGTGRVTAELSGIVDKDFLVSALNADLVGRGLVLDGKKYGELNASAKTAGNRVEFSAGSSFGGSALRVSGQTRLEKDYPTTASATAHGFPVEQVVDWAKGRVEATGRLTGSLKDPQATGEFNWTQGSVEDEPFDQLRASVAFTNRQVAVSNLELTAGGARVEANGAFDHADGDYAAGRVKFHLASNGLQLEKIRTVQAKRPGLKGSLQISADGSGSLVKVAKGVDASPFVLSILTASVAARGLEADKKKLGDATVSAETRAGDLLLKAESNLGGASLKGDATVKMTGDYPVSGRVSFAGLTYEGLRPLFDVTGQRPNFDVASEGAAVVVGSLWRPEELTGTLTVSKLAVTAKQRVQAGAQPVTLSNPVPIVAVLGREMFTIQGARLTGPATDLGLAGTVALNGGKSPLNLQLDSKTDLKLLESFDRDIYAAGAVALKATVRGTFGSPQVQGQLTLKNASINTIELPNGVSNANGVVNFNGTTAVVQNLTAESGGGRVQLAGYVGFADLKPRFGLRANAGLVRVRAGNGASVVLSANLNLTGTSDKSVLAGTVTINRLAFNPQSDFGSLLSRTAPPVETPVAPSGPLAGMKLDVRIRTAADIAVATALAQNLQTDADLTLRGTAANPGMLGKLNVRSGKVVFFGTEYTVNSGSVSFFNPLRIEPILDVDLETKSQGVDVIVSVSGPVSNMKLTYRSDPALQFSEIVALLAAGTTPTSDPTILANQPLAPPQNLQSMGETAIVSQAIASPVASRLQRVFGVSKLKIDPSFTSGSALPSARLTLQQQVASNVTFTYITDLTQSNSQIIRVEWAVNPQWSAVATRDENGRFGIDFFFKKQFR